MNHRFVVIFVVFATIFFYCKLSVGAAQTDSVHILPAPLTTSGGIDWAHLSAAQLSALDPKVFKTVTSENLASIPSYACSGFRKEQLSMFPTSSVTGGSPCSGFKLACYQNIPSDTFQGFQRSCITGLKTEVFSSTSALQFSKLSTEAVAGITADQMKSLKSGTCFGITAAQLSIISNSATEQLCSVIQPECLSVIPPENMAELSGSCLSILSDNSFSAITLNQVVYLTPSTLSYITKDKMALWNNQCAGISPAQFAQLFGHQACAGISTDCVSKIIPDAFNKIPQTCLSILQPSTVAALKGIQMSRIPSSLFSVWSKEQVAQFGQTSDSCSGLKPDQVSRLSYLVCSSIHGKCINQLNPYTFSGFSGACISNWNDEAISKINRFQMSNITNSAINKIDAHFIKELSAEACYGIRRDQLLNLAPTSCSGMTSACVGHIRLESFSGITPACIVQLPSEAFSGITADQFSTLIPIAVASLGADDLHALKPETCVGFTKDQISALADGVCEGLSAKCVDNIPAVSFYGFHSRCIDDLPSSSIEVLDRYQLNNIPERAFRAIDAEQLSKLSHETCMGLRPEHITSLENSDKKKTCSGFIGDCLKYVPAASFSGFTEHCLANLPSLSDVSSTQLGLISPPAMVGATDKLLKTLKGDSCKGLKKGQMVVLSSACSGFTSGCVKNMDPLVFSGVQHVCASRLSPQVFDVITQDQIAQLRDDAVPGLYKDQMKHLNPVACIGFSAHKIELLSSGTDQSACSGISSKCLANFDMFSIKGLKAECVSSLPEDAFKDIDYILLAHIVPDAMRGLSAPMLKNLNVDSCAGWTGDQLLHISNPDACSGFKNECINKISPASFIGLNSACVSKLDDKAFSKISAQQLHNLGEGAHGLTKDLIKNLNVKACYGFTSRALSMIQGTTDKPGCAGFQKDCLSSILPLAFSGFRGDCIAKMDKDALSKIDAFQLQHLSGEAVSGFDQQTMKHLNPLTCSGFSASHISYLNNMPDKLACKGLTKECMSNLKTTSFAGFNAGCTSLFDPKVLEVVNSVQLAQFSPVAIKGLTDKMIKQIPAETCSGFTRNQLSSFNSDINACKGLSADCIKYIADKEVSGFKGGCFSDMHDKSIEGLRLEHFKFLTSDAIGGFRPGHFERLSTKWKLGFIDQMRFDQLELVPYTTILSFKMLKPKAVRQLASSEISRLTWLQLTVCSTDSVKKYLNRNMMMKMEKTTYQGLTHDQVKVLPDDVFVGSLSPQLGHLLPDAIEGLRPKQIPFLPPVAFDKNEFGEGLGFFFTSFSEECVASLTNAQLMHALTPPTYLTLMTCKQYFALTEAQMDYLGHKTQGKAVLRYLHDTCGDKPHPTPTPTPTPTPIPTPTPPVPSPTPTPTPTPTPVPSPTPQPRPSPSPASRAFGWTKLAIFIAFSSFAFVI